MSFVPYLHLNIMGKIAGHVALLSCCVLLLALPVAAIAQPSNDPEVESGVNQAQSDSNYYLGASDKLEVTVFGQKDLSGEYNIDGNGNISFPLIGSVKSSGLTVTQLGKAIIKQLKNGYLKDPKVNVAVTVFRPFYILGEVEKPGSYSYVSGMTVWNAVALSGGFTKRADKDGVIIKRTVEGGKKKVIKSTIDTVVVSGDIITIEQRLF